MALNSDIAFKFGCGRYIQERGAIEKNLLTELKRFGKKTLFVCGENGYRVAIKSIEKALEETLDKYVNGMCKSAVINDLSEESKEKMKNALLKIC